MDKPPQPVIGLLGPASDTTDALNALLRQTPYPIQTAGTCDALFSLSGDYAAIVSDAGQQAELLDRLQRSGHRTTAIIHFPQSDSDPLPDPFPPTGCVYLCRPVAPQTLLTTIAQAVERWQLAAETKKLKIENDAYREQLSKQVTSRVEELLQSQEFLFTLTEVMTDSVLSLTGDVTDMRIEFANSAACRVFNYSRAEFIGQSMRMLYPEQAAFDACRQKLQQVLQANGPELRLEQHLRKKTGEHIWVENVTTFMYSDGRLQRVISILRDITGRKAKEAELQQRNEELAALNAIAAAINQTPSLDPVLKTALGQIEAALGLKHSEIWLLDRRTNLLRPRIHYGLPESFAKEIPAFKVGVGLPGVVAQTRHPLMVPDLATNPHYMRQRAAHYKLKGALGIPLLAQDKVVGVMNFFTYGSTAFTPEIIASLETVGHLVGAAIENARLFDELQRQTQELSGLYETALATSSVLDVDLMLARLHDQVQQLLNPDTFMVALYNDNTNKFKIALAAELGRDLTPDVEHDRYPIEAGGLTGWVMRNKQPLLIGDILADPLPVDPKHLTEPSRAWLGVPLIARDQMIGAVSVQSFQPHAFNRADRRFLEAIAGQVAIAIENARLFEAERLRHHEIEAVQRVSLSLTAPPKLPQVFEAILRAALNLVPALDTHIFLYTGTRLIFGAAMWADGSRSEPFSNPRAGGLTDVVSKTGELVAVNDMQNHPLFKDVSPEWTGAILGIPLKIGPTVVGVMNIAYPHPRQFPETELRVLSLLAAQAAIAIENARLFEQAQQEISERKRTEAALRESEEKYRTLIEQSNDAIYLIYNHKFEIINRKFKDLFDVTQTDVQAPDFSLLNLVVPSSRLLIEQHLARQESGQPTPNRVEFTALTGDRREIDVELSV
ncbi:MAG: GAF domain-containing protein, partial [Anaerolineae bacterium]